MPNTTSWVEINSSALTENIDSFRNLIGSGVALMAVVKADAYGHGLVNVAKVAVASGVTWLGVNNLEEALRLRREGVLLPILILGMVRPESLVEAVENDISLTVYNHEILEALGNIDTLSKIHLKIETGTGRQGILPEEIPTYMETLSRYPQITLEGLSTHFANLEDANELTYAIHQLQCFQKVGERVRGKIGRYPIRHSACTAAVFSLPSSMLDLVRIGIGMYGLWPSPSLKALAQDKFPELRLQPALAWKTVVAQVKRFPKGAKIGYGCSYETSRDSMIAVLPVGYYDGYDRRLSPNGRVLVGGKGASVVGRICMNMMMIDVTDISDVCVESEVVLLGKQGDGEIPAEELAERIGTINYEVVSRINPLLPRIYV